jgi:Domain of unknown function (DUF6531)
MLKIRLLQFFLLCLFLGFFQTESKAQDTSAPAGWEAFVHFYGGSNYTGALSLGKTPPGSQNFASPSSACNAALNYANQIEPGKNYTVVLADDFEEGLSYPIFSYAQQKYVATGYFNGYRCQLKESGSAGYITDLGWQADVAIAIVPACPYGKISGFFDGGVRCGNPVVGSNISKPNTCTAGAAPLTKPKCLAVGNPISVDNGEKIEKEQDYVTADGLLAVERSYRSGQSSALSTTETPGYGRNWRGLLPGRLLAHGSLSGSQIYAFTVEYQSADGSHELFQHNGWAFNPIDATRLKLSSVAELSTTPVDFFQVDIASIDTTGELKLSFANGDYILFSRSGAYSRASKERTLVPVERGFANGYKIWFDYPDKGQYPSKLRDSQSRIDIVVE